MLHQKEQRKMMTNLGSKPHNLSKQNELIQRMMAGTAN